MHGTNAMIILICSGSQEVFLNSFEVLSIFFVHFRS